MGSKKAERRALHGTGKQYWRRLGAEVEEFEDGFAVCGGTLKGGTACANGDHRLAMSMAVCGLCAPVSVEGAEILNESFPDFERVIMSLM